MITKLHEKFCGYCGKWVRSDKEEDVLAHIDVCEKQEAKKEHGRH